MSKMRGFEVVKPEHRMNFSKTGGTMYKNYVMVDGEVRFLPDITLPERSTSSSAGYDFYVPTDIQLLPQHKYLIWTDVKAYMQPDEVLKLYIRSSVGHKLGIWLTNQTGIIDADYYSNEDNDGNIGLALINTTGLTVNLKAGDRICQGIFEKYLLADADDVKEVRKGGTGSTGK